MSGRSGMYVGLTSTATSTVEISNSTFSDSCIQLETIYGSTNSTKIILVGTILRTVSLQGAIVGM